MLQTIEKVGLRWLLRFRKLDMTQPEQRQALVDTFINAIYLYDDKVLITFNYKEGTETVAFGEAVKAEKSSDMSARGAPDKKDPNHFSKEKGSDFLFSLRWDFLIYKPEVLYYNKVITQQEAPQNVPFD